MTFTGLTIAGATLAAVLATVPAPCLAAKSPTQVYVDGQFAESIGDFAEAAQYLGSALQAEPTDVVLQRRVFDLSLQSGDLERALRLARQLVETAPNDSQIVLVLAMDAVRKNDWTGASQRLSGMSSAGLDGILGPVLKAWVAVGRGKPEEASDILAVLDKTPSFRPFAVEQRAWIALETGQWAVASQAFAGIVGESGASGSVRNRLAAAAAAQRAGDMARVNMILGKDASGQDHPWLVQARKAFAAGDRLPVPSTAQAGISEMLQRVALDLSREESPVSAPGYAWLAAWLSPGKPEILFTLIDVLTTTKQPATALTLLESVPHDDASDQLAALARARILLTTDKDKEAVSVLEAAAKRWPDRLDFQVSLADAYRSVEAYSRAVEAYTKSIAMVGTPAENNWGLFFARGISYERLKQWDNAEADLRAALRLKPDQPTVLNFLGYSWLEQKRNLPQATEMIEKALEQRPSDGAIVDSLGWALFLNGKVDQAVDKLEEALVAVPYDPTVNEHLGDAYWATGRRIEARHRWQAALDAGPDAPQKIRLTEKLDSGLMPAAG
jgi:predicted Zn-dependent protease